MLVLYGTLDHELGFNVLWALCLLVHIPFGALDSGIFGR